MSVVGTMIALYAPLIVNYGDFSRYVRSQSEMKWGNILGLMINIGFFALIALLVTAGARVVFGKTLTDPTAMIKLVDDPVLTVAAALTFFIATVGINVVGNFVPPANDLSNLLPRYVSFRRGGMIAATLAFVVSALWVSLISRIGLIPFVNILGALLAPAYGILIADYYLVRKQSLRIAEMYVADPDGHYHYANGWNPRALIAFVLAGIFSVLAATLPALQPLSGFDWLIGALLAGVFYRLLAGGKVA
jgi:NCS1 family nucleobase:cation symporter-1